MSIPFPEPVRISRRNYWRRRQLRDYVAAAAGEPPPEPRQDDEQLMTARAVRTFLGDVSQMWIWRRRNDVAPAKENAGAPS